MIGLNYKSQQDIAEDIAKELRDTGYLGVQVTQISEGRFCIDTDTNLNYLNFYSSHQPDFICSRGLHVDLDDTREMIDDSKLNGSSILKDVTDITDIQPHEYGILKLKYGLEKHHLFIPKFMKPMVREFHEKVRKGLL